MISESIILRRLFVANIRKCKKSRSVFVNVMNMVILGPAHYVAFDTEHTNTSVALIYGHGTAQPIGLMRQQKAGI